MKQKLLLAALLAIFTALYLNSSLHAHASHAPEAPSATWDWYVYPDEVNPNIQSSFNFKVKNVTSSSTYHSIYFGTPNVTNNFQITGVSAIREDGTPFLNGSQYSNTYAQVGTFQNKLNLAPGETIDVFVNVNVGCINLTPGVCSTDPLAEQIGHWTSNYYEWNSNGTLKSNFSATGNTHLKVTNYANPRQQPLDWALDNEYSRGLNDSGLSDPSLIQGLFPPGPVDSIVVLPLNILTQILNASQGAVTTPTLDLFGKTMTFPSGQLFYNQMGGVVTTLITAGMSFFMLYFWLKNLYFRLHRATSLRSGADDAWGIL